VSDEAWAVRLYYKPFIQWIWFGALIMSIGGIIAVSDRRYRLAARVRAPARTAAGSTAPAASGGMA
jgi:cytochrome c-type biogenesis protein CcmF